MDGEVHLFFDQPAGCSKNKIHVWPAYMAQTMGQYNSVSLQNVHHCQFDFVIVFNEPGQKNDSRLY